MYYLCYFCPERPGSGKSLRGAEGGMSVFYGYFLLNRCACPACAENMELLHCLIKEAKGAVCTCFRQLRFHPGEVNLTRIES